MRARPALGLALITPAALLVAGGFVIPVLILLSAGFRVEGRWTLAAYADFFAQPLDREVFWRTLKIASEVTLVCAVAGYAVALAISQAGPAARGKLIGLIALPLMISPVARTYAWIVIMGRTGPINLLVTALHLGEPLRLLFSETAIFVGLVQLFLPLMVLPLVGALDNLPRDVVPAARILGASALGAFFKVVLPLTREGLVTGGTLVFAGSLTAYVTPAMLGGAKVLMLETLLYQRVNVAGDVASASVIGAILLAMGVVSATLLRRIGRGRTA